MTYREISITAYLTAKKARQLVRDLTNDRPVDQIEVVCLLAEADGLKSLLPIIKSATQRKLIHRACNTVGQLMLYTK